MIHTQKIALPRMLAEGTAILGSILLAFWIDAWWENREERELGYRYLVALQEDFTILDRELKIQLEHAASVMRNAEVVLTMASGPDAELLSDSFSRAVGAVYSIRQPNIAVPTYHDMINSGNLRLITNRELRIRMAKLIEVLQYIDEQAAIINKTYWTHHAAFMDANFVVSELGWFDDPTSEAAKERYQIMGVLPKAPFDTEVSAVRTRQFWNLIYDWTTMYGDQLTPIISARDLGSEVLVILDEEIQSFEQ